jgi:hypothetical protein
MTPPLRLSPATPVFHHARVWPRSRGACGDSGTATANRIAHRGCDLVAQLTAAAFAIPYGEIAAATRRTREVAFARQCAMYLARVGLVMNYRDIGRAFGRDRTTAAHACRQVESCRDDPAVDELLGRLERACCVLRFRSVVRVRP